jgi:hypothetical protein
MQRLCNSSVDAKFTKQIDTLSYRSRFNLYAQKARFLLIYKLYLRIRFFLNDVMVELLYSGINTNSKKEFAVIY